MLCRRALSMRIRMSEKPESYEVAVARLETIIARLDSGEAELRETLRLCGEESAKALCVIPYTKCWQG
jgi:exonuclease VII small subunit